MMLIGKMPKVKIANYDHLSRSTQEKSNNGRKLTHKTKRDKFSSVVERDGHRCLYCPEPFTDTHPVEWKHLDNDIYNDEVWNLTFAHHECNNKKKFSAELQIIAQEKIISNKRYVFARERTLADTGTTKETTSQQEINRINMGITKQFLLEHTLIDGDLLLKEAINAIVDICQKNNGTGSQSAVYRYIDSLTNPYTGDYTLSVNSKGQTIIRRRTEN